MQDYSGLYRTTKDHTGLYRAIQENTGLYRTLRRLYRTIQDYTE